MISQIDTYFSMDKAIWLNNKCVKKCSLIEQIVHGYGFIRFAPWG